MAATTPKKRIADFLTDIPVFVAERHLVVKRAARPVQADNFPSSTQRGVAWLAGTNFVIQMEVCGYSVAVSIGRVLIATALTN